MRDVINFKLEAHIRTCDSMGRADQCESQGTADSMQNFRMILRCDMLPQPLETASVRSPFYLTASSVLHRAKFAHDLFPHDEYVMVVSHAESLAQLHIFFMSKLEWLRRAVLGATWLNCNSVH